MPRIVSVSLVSRDSHSCEPRATATPSRPIDHNLSRIRAALAQSDRESTYGRGFVEHSSSMFFLRHT